MPRLGPIKREDLVRHLANLGFEGPYSGSKHQFMIKDKIRLFIPNPHRGQIGKELLLRILKQADISRNEWEKLK